jgi:A/G-specific adenine glycosylase
MKHITHKIVEWYDQNKRELPWRITNDPYKIWLSEVILQQTRVQQGLAYYMDFVAAWPDVASLAKASPGEVMKRWQGLGYYSRARNLHKTAQIVHEEMNDVFPPGYDQLRKLPGIGPYTAAAIASFAFGKAHPVIDGNVERVMSRLLGIMEPSNSPHSKKRIEDELEVLIDRDDPGRFNQAIMEFGALQCTPKNPGCDRCPLKDTCRAYAMGKVEEIPVPKPKVKQKNRYFNYLVTVLSEPGEKNVVLKQRVEKDIWHSLYDFPLIETPRNIPPEKLEELPEWKKMLNGQVKNVVMVSKSYKHLLSHQKITARFVLLELSSIPDHFKKVPYVTINLESFGDFPVSRLLEIFYADYGTNILKM